MVHLMQKRSLWLTQKIALWHSLRPKLLLGLIKRHVSRVMRKPMFCICENKDVDQLRGSREADQHLCFRYIDSTIRLLSKSEISSLYPSSAAVQVGLCRTRSETRTLVFTWRGSCLCDTFMKPLFLSYCIFRG